MDVSLRRCPICVRTSPYATSMDATWDRVDDMCLWLLDRYSLLLTRTLDQCKQDMDDSSATLTATFGHCTQELMNLVLSGHVRDSLVRHWCEAKSVRFQAASQVHDGIIPLEDTGLMLRGIDKQPSVGYLSHLEVLRYTKVNDVDVGLRAVDSHTHAGRWEVCTNAQSSRSGSSAPSHTTQFCLGRMPPSTTLMNGKSCGARPRLRSRLTTPHKVA